MRGEIREKVLKALSTIVVLNMAFGGFLGLMMIEEGPAMVAEGFPVTEYNGDIIIDGVVDRNITNVHFKLDGDIIIRNNGELHITNAILEFLVDINQSNRHTLRLESGGKLFLNDAQITISTRDLENYEDVYWFGSADAGAKFTRPIMFNITAQGLNTWVHMVDSELAYHGYLDLDGCNVTMRNSKTTHPYAPRSTYKWGVILRVTNGSEAILEDSIIESSPYLQGVSYNGGVPANNNITMYDYHKIVDSRLVLINTYLDINFENRYNPSPPAAYDPTGSPDFWPNDAPPNTPDDNTNYEKRMLWIERSEAKFFGLTVNMAQTGNAINPVYGQTALYVADTASDVALFRWLVVEPLDNASVPVEGSIVQVKPILGPPLSNNITNLNNPANNYEVTDYLTRTTDATIYQNGTLLEGETGSSGRVIFGVVSDLIEPDDMPNSQFVGIYNVTASYEDLGASPAVPWSVTYGNAGLTEYPFVTEDDNYFYFDPSDPDRDMPPFNYRLPHPDLYATFTTSLPSTLVNGTTLPINITVTNWKDPIYGGLEVFDVRVVIWDGDPDLNTSTRIGFDEITNISSGSSATVEFDWTPTVPGVYTIWVAVDRDYTKPFNDNVIAELDETNNEIKPRPSVAVLTKPDLIVEEINFNAPDVQGSYVEEGEVVQIQARIKNQGGADAEFFNVTFYDGPVGGTLIGEVTVSKLTGNDGQKTVSIDWVPTEGTHNISVIVDEVDIIPELIDNNNELAKVIIVKSRPDLQLIVTISPEPSFEGDTLSIDISVTNAGGWNITDSFTLEVYDGDVSGPTTLIDTYTIPWLDSIDWQAVSGNVHTVFVNFTRTATYPPSAQYIWAEVDTGDVITESDEANNLQFGNFTVNPKPNLVVETGDIVFTPDGYPMNGSSVTIDVTIHNMGLFDVPVNEIPFYVELWLDDPETGTLLTTLTVNSVILSMNSTVVQYVWPVATPPGEHYIYAVVDTEDNVSETTNADNTASARIILYEVPTDLIVNNTYYGTLTLEGANPYARDGFTLVEENGILIVKNSIFRVEGQLFDDEWNIIVREDGTLIIEDDSLITSDGKHVNIYLYDNAELYIMDSRIDDMIDIIATDNSQIFISDGSIIESDIYSNSQNTYANITIVNSTLSKDLQYIGGNTVVELWGVFIAGNPADETVVTVADNATVYVDWFLQVYIVDANNVPIENANVNWFRSPPWSDTGSGVSDSDGIALFRLRGRNITADNVVIGIGNYQIKANFTSPVTMTTYYPDDYVTVWMTTNIDTTLYFTDVKPDLDPPLYIEWPGSFPAVGDTLTIISWVNNTGSNAAENVYVVFFDNRSTTGLPLTLYNLSIPAGGSWYIEFTVVPTQPGVHNISIHIDPDNITWEYEEGDNVNWKYIDVAAQKADLELTSSDIWFTSDNPLGQNEYTEDDQITIHAQISNLGATDAFPVGGLQVAYYEGFSQIGIDIIPGVAAGDSAESTFVWTGTSPNGTYAITVIVDNIPPPPGSFGVVQETDENNNQGSRNINIRAKADLIVVGIQFFVSGSPVSSVPDTTLVTITATVQNTGGTNATGVKVSFSDGDGGPAIGSEQTISFVAIGSTGQASVTWTATVAGLSEVHSIYAIVSGVEESNYSNNDHFEYINVTLRPDLTVENIVFDDNSPFEGQDLTITATIRNSGGTSADNFYVSFWDGDPTSEGSQIQGDQGPITVGIGLTDSVQVTWNNPTPGSHNIYIKADDELDINEFNEENNIESRVIVVYSGNDLIVNNTNTPKIFATAENALEPDVIPHRGFTLVEENGELTFDYITFIVVQRESYEFNIIVRNNGKLIIRDNSLITTDGFLLRIYLYDEATLEISDSIISANIVEIQAFDNAEIIIEESEINSFIKVTSSTAAVTLTATNSSISQAFINFGGDSYATFTNVYTPNVLISDNAQLDVYRWLEAYVIDGAGGPIPEAVVEVRDFEDYPLPPSKLTDDSGMALFAVLTDEITADNVFSHFTFKAYASYYYFPLDQYFFGNDTVTFETYLVDPRENIQEAEIILWDLRPDLTVDGADITFYGGGENRGEIDTATVGVGELITVEVIVHNVGTSLAKANSTVVRIYHEIIPGKEFEIGRTIITDSIPANGGTRTASITWVPKDNEIANGLFFYAEVDPEDDIAELDEFNNEDFTDVNIVLPADLEVSNVRFEVNGNQDTDNTTEGQEVTIAVRIENVGAKDVEIAKSITVAAYIGFPDRSGDGKPDSPLDGDVTLIESIDLGPGIELDRDESTIVYLTWDTTGLIAGHFIYCYVLHATDIKGFVIPDTKLANNNMSKEFLVHPKPDLRPRLIPPETQYVLVFNSDGTPYTGDELQVGQRVRLQATIRNDGQVYLPVVNVTFYDGVPGDPDTDQIGSNQTITLGSNDDVNVSVIWEVDAAVGTVDLTVYVNEFREVPESDYTNNYMSETYNVALAEITLGWLIVIKSSYTVGDTIDVQVSTLFTDTGDGVPSVPYTIRIRNAVTDEAVGAAVTGTSNPVGSIVNEITAPTTDGEYYVQITVTYGGVPHELNSATFEVEPEEPEFPWLLILLLIIVAIVAVLIVGVALAKFGMGKLVECGECGAFIPEGEKKCPKCGAVFETDTARCSECGGWIPVKSKSCPECGAIFAGIEKDKKDYIERMKTQYMEYVDQYRDEAKGDLGDDMTDEQFMDWWKANPKYVGFEEWLAREEELRKGKTRNCPECSIINPESAAICFKCGTIFKTEEEEEDFIEGEAGPPPEVPAKAVPATVAPKAAPPTVVPKKVVQSPRGGGAPPTVVPKKVVQAPPTVVPKKVIKKPPEEK